MYFGDYGYAYIKALTKAIEEYTKESEALSKSAFQYRNASLKYAFERSLYFRYVNDDELIQLYDDQCKKYYSNHYSFSDNVKYSLAKYIIDDIELLSNLSYTQPAYKLLNYKKAIYKVRLFFVYLKHLMCNIIAIIDNSDKYNSGYFVITHEKSLRYLKPIAEPIQGSRYLFVDGRLSKSFKDLGLSGTRVVIHGSINSYLSESSRLHESINLIFMFDSLYQHLMKYKPRFLIIPEGDAPIYEVLNQICKLLSIPIICIQYSWPPVIHPGFRNMSYSRMFVWGNGFADLLKPYNPKMEFVTTGSHVISHKNNSKNEECFTSMKDGICFLLQVKGALISNRCWKNYLQLIEWSSETFPELIIYIREHPSHPVNEDDYYSLFNKKNIKLASPSEWNLEELLERCFISVSVYSTTILESIAAGVLPIIYNETSLPKYNPDVSSYNAGIEVKGLNAAKREILKIINNLDILNAYKKSTKAFANKYFYCDEDNMPINKIKSEIEKIEYIQMKKDNK